MHSIITELEEQAAVQVMHIWRQLHDACGLEGIFNFPNPHFTWFSVDDMDIERTSAILEDLVRTLVPFSVHTGGLGIFPGDAPVLYLPLVKSAHLMDLHRKVLGKIQPYCHGIKDIFMPEFWVPHITLALRDLNKENFSCAIDSVGFEPVEVFTKVDNLLVVKSDGNEIGDTLERFTFADLESDQ